MSSSNKPVSQIADLKQRKFLFTFLVFLLVVILLWVMMNLFTAQNTLKISTELKNLASPLTPSVDTTVLDTLEKKQIYSVSDLAKFDIYMVQEDENNKNLMKIVKVGADQLVVTPSPAVSNAAKTVTPAVASPAANVMNFQ